MLKLNLTKSKSLVNPKQQTGCDMMKQSRGYRSVKNKNPFELEDNNSKMCKFTEGILLFIPIFVGKILTFSVCVIFCRLDYITNQCWLHLTNSLSWLTCLKNYTEHRQGAGRKVNCM